MLQGHSVGVAGEAQRQQSHVQHAVAEAAVFFQPGCAVAAQDADGLFCREAVVASGHRRMGGKDALAADLLDVGVSNRAQRTTAQLALKQRQSQQSRMALVHVVDVDAITERIGHAHTAHAQHNLLLQAVVAVATVEMVGEAAIPARVAVDVCIEQVNRHHVAKAALHVITPGPDRNDAFFNGDGNPDWFLGTELLRVPGLDVLALRTGGIQMLLKVALAMQQRKSDERNA